MNKSIALWGVAFVVVIAGLTITVVPRVSVLAANRASQSTFSDAELRAFTAIEPIDTHAHAFKPDPTFYSMLNRLHLHLVDICVANRNDSHFPNLPSQIKAVKSFVHESNGRAVLCTTFDPFKFSDAAFPKEAIHQLNGDFAEGAVAVMTRLRAGVSK